MVPWQSSATCEVRTGFGFFCRQRFGSILRTLAPGAIIAGGGGVATTLSGGNAVAILPKDVVGALATGGKMLEQALVSGADNCLRQTPHARTWNNPRRWRWSRGGVAATLSG